MKIIKTIFAILICSFLFFFNAKSQELEKWADNHPEASKALGEWIKLFPDAAHYIFEWDGNHPERSEALVTWAITHPGENLSVFHAQHKNWPELELIVGTHRAGSEAFLKWCRTYHDAARTLMLHSGGLKWAGNHLYQASNTATK